LNLLGDVEGRDVLEIGCGGAQCSIAFALRGARVTAVDLSDEQLKFARDLAAQHGVEIALLQHDISDLSSIPPDSQDIVFSAFALTFVADRAQTFREVCRVLRPGGTFVFSLDHPFFRKVDPETLKLVESYNETGPLRDDRGELGQVTIYRYNVGDLHEALVAAGLAVERIIEPDSRKRYSYDPWFGRRGVYFPKILDMVPPTIIFKSVKPAG
jgi:ubiquinone/menaquinone biosynthesis C-methylase UbiE